MLSRVIATASRASVVARTGVRMLSTETKTFDLAVPFDTHRESSFLRKGVGALGTVGRSPVKAN
jgi:hypothetical protein